MANEIDSTATGTKAQKQILTDLRARFGKALEADDQQRRDAMEDMKFSTVPGNQWEENQTKERGRRPCYEFNKIRVTGKRIINNIRDNRPAGKIRGTEDNDKDTAEIFEGLIRNIWAKNGDHVMDYAAEYQVFAGYGAWRIDVEESDTDPFNPNICPREIPNPFCLFSDPSSRDILKRDASWWILTEQISAEEFDETYGEDTERVNFESHEFDDEEDWDGDEVRIAEYWYKEPITKEIWQLEDGKVVDSESRGAEVIPEELIAKRKTVNTHKIMHCIATGNAILEGPTEYEGTMFPFVPIYGEYYIVDGKTYWNGITRFAKDAQRSYNIARTAISETIAMAPQSKWWSTAQQAEGHEKSWKVAHQKNYPFMLYNPDPQVPGPPARMGGPDVPVALIQESQLAAEEINMVTGIYQNDIGAPNQASSGRQEIARQQAGAIATFNYSDNMAKAIERTWEILIDLVPKVYTTKRSIRVLGADGAENYTTIYDVAPHPITGELTTVHDLSVGKYDVTVTTGPNFSTQRQEAADVYQGLLQGNPNLFPIIGDLIFKSMDLPYADEISERLQVMLPPQIKDQMDEGKNAPPEVMAMMQKAKQAMMMVEQQKKGLEEAAAKIQQEASATDQAKAEVQKLIADLATKQAQFEAKIAQDFARVAQQEAGITKNKVILESREAVELNKQAATESIAQYQNALAQDTSGILTEFQGIAEQLSQALGQQTAAAVDAIKTEREKKPLITKVVSKRVNGRLEAIPVYGETLQ